ncbi:catechol 2,3-dioxygenase-like lactoylglutathione lyase family enzyme [Lewinella aquimaris]|uniref:Catechol 2,3-dioxygenase-like lactoylglutathione lyase family enzyme n=1 Tax=Neolewinella aquimaris TaxID=1835722 RepID=A0A840E428_9BACT|nr:VOC family protein [Neolewinella aquimaris]MBB4077847.1 catechol 2,3-dioxygenase-like lactoylglutathione lyase family enzyme [Neolewinella aquimaris]
MRYLLLFSLLLPLLSCSPRLDPFGTETGDYLASFDHYAINVENLNRSIDFYQQVFGLDEVHNGTGKENIRWLSLGAGMALHVIETDRSQLRLQKGVHMAISVGRFDEFVEHLRDIELPFETWQGVALESNDRPDGVRQVYFQDPDGYWIEVNNGRILFGKPALP